jgi:hypothetical protein
MTALPPLRPLQNLPMAETVNPNNHFVKWVYGSQHQGPRNLIDPRIPIARHIDWHKSSTAYTEFSIPEPENYNRAIWSLKPMEFVWVQDQVIYYDAYRAGWITVCYLPDDQIAKFDEWVVLMDMTYWRHLKSPVLKMAKPMLMQGATSVNMSLDERLLTLGYYKDFIVKYFDGDALYVKSRLGEARANLKDLLKDE